VKQIILGNTVRHTRRTRAAECGFSLVELMAVVSIAIITMAIATPIMINALSSYKVRGQMTDLSGLVQMCRSEAVKQNQTRHLIFTTSGTKTLSYVDTPGSTLTMPTSTMPQVWLPRQMQKVSAPTSSPTPLNSSSMWGDGLGTAPNTTDDVCFNSRGIPCSCPSTPTATCSGITNGYAFYFTLTSQPGGTRWAAVGVSPAGRIKTFFWDGGAWTN
jgi:Tfp pilus assembly protein FimT